MARWFAGIVESVHGTKPVGVRTRRHTAKKLVSCRGSLDSSCSAIEKMHSKRPLVELFVESQRGVGSLPVAFGAHLK